MGKICVERLILRLITWSRYTSDQAKRVFAMFPDLVMRYHWVLPPYEYQDQEHLLASLQTKIIGPAEQKAQELEKR